MSLRPRLPAILVAVKNLACVMAAVLFGSLTLHSGDAEACGGPTCEAVSYAFLEGAELPANVAGIGAPTFESGSWGNSTRPLFQKLRGATLTADGGASRALPALVDDAGLFSGWAIPGGLQTGESYLLELEAGGCLARDGGGARPTRRGFRAGPVTPFPESLGTVTASQAEIRDAWTQGGSTCSYGQRSAIISLQVAPTAELVPFLPVTRWELFVDGKSWVQAGYGEVSADGTVFHPKVNAPGNYSPPEDDRRLDSVYAPCEPVAGGLAPGEHSLQLVAHVAGRPRIEGSTLTVNMNCDLPSEDGPFGCNAAPNPGAAATILAVVVTALAGGRRRITAADLRRRES